MNGRGPLIAGLVLIAVGLAGVVGLYPILLPPGTGGMMGGGGMIGRGEMKRMMQGMMGIEAPTAKEQATLLAYLQKHAKQPGMGGS